MLNPVVVSKYLHLDDFGNLSKNLHITEKPHLIWNCDETGCSFEHEQIRVIAEKFDRNILARTSNNKTNVTIMTCVNTAGNQMPPMLIVRGKTSVSLHGFNKTVIPEGTKWAFQKSGRMTDEIGEHWFRNIFLKECGKERPHSRYLMDSLSTKPHTFCNP